MAVCNVRTADLIVPMLRTLHSVTEPVNAAALAELVTESLEPGLSSAWENATRATRYQKTMGALRVLEARPVGTVAVKGTRAAPAFSRDSLSVKLRRWAEVGPCRLCGASPVDNLVRSVAC